MRRRAFPHALLSVFTLGVTCLLGGCSANFQPNPHQTDLTPVGSMQGVLRGGQSPISGGEIYLFAAGTSGYASAAQSRLTSGDGVGTGIFNGDTYVLTDANGNFNISGDYTCVAGTQMYLVAYGGNPGLSPSTTFNTAIVQMAGLGQCPASGNLASQVPYVTINEVSTVVFAYAMSGFGTSATNIGSGSSAAAQAAIANAMANVSNVMSIWYGQAYTSAAGNSNSVVPQTKIYTLANILAACVNSSDPTQPGCTGLFGYATSNGTVTGTVPTDESTAMFNIVHNPMANTSSASLFSLQSATPPFVGLSGAPTDWTLPVVYNGVAGRPGNLAIDSLGNAWVSDRLNDAVVKVGAQGAVTTIAPSGMGSIYNVEVDPGNVVWAADYSKNQVYRLDTSGNVLSDITTGGLNEPTAIAFSSAGAAYVTNAGSATISRYSGAGAAQTAGSYPAGLGTPYGIALDNSGNAWIPTYGASCACVGKLANGGTAASDIQDQLLDGIFGLLGTGQLADSYAIAMDSGHNTWQVNLNNELVEFSVGTFLIVNYINDGTTATGGGMNAPVSLVVDGGGNLWMANSGANTVSAFTSAGVALTASGFPTGSASTAMSYGAAVDGSGDVWTANSDGTVTEILGLATPTATPMLPNQAGTKP